MVVNQKHLVNKTNVIVFNKNIYVDPNIYFHKIKITHKNGPFHTISGEWDKTYLKI